MTHPEPPTDLELMMYADGELEPERARVVEAAIARDAVARGKLVSLGMVGDALRQRPWAVGSMAEDVMARIEHEALPRVVKKPGSRAANDNRPRGAWYALAGFAAAAAAAGAIAWASLGGPSAEPRVARATRATPSNRATAAAVVDSASVLSADLPMANGVEVSAVEFGKRTGRIFYVPNGASSAKATVIWLSEEPPPLAPAGGE